MKRTFKANAIKWTTESLLIVLSVLLAFYLENLRQSNIEKKRLITSLHELKESIVLDTSIFQSIANHNVLRLDTIFRETLDLIKNKERVNYILQELYLNDIPKYTNWTVTRMLQGDELQDLNGSLKAALWEYNMRVELLESGEMDIIKENNKKATELVFYGIKYKDDFSKIYRLGDDQPLMRFREYRDSSIVYSDQLKSYLIYNLVALQSLRHKLLTHSEDALPVIMMLDKKIKELE